MVIKLFLKSLTSLTPTSLKILKVLGRKTLKWVNATPPDRTLRAGGRRRKALPFHSFTRRRVLSLLLAVLITLTSLRFLFFKPTEVRADSLLKFDEGNGSTVNDANGNVVGTITNALWRTDDLCFDGKCLFFDGTGDFVSFGDDPDLDIAAADQVTIQGWFRTGDITSGQRTILAKYETVGADGGYKVYMNSSGFLVFGIDNDNSGFPSDSVTSSTAYDDNRWHHFSAVKNGTSSISLYVDARFIGTDSSITSSTLENDDTFYIGIDGDGSSNGWVGFIDEIKIYRSARTQAEINTDYLGATASRGTAAAFGYEKTYLSEGLVGFWRMDDAGIDAEGEISNDSSGNGLNATLYGDNGTGDNGTGMDCTVTGKFKTGCDVDGTDDYLSVANNAMLNTVNAITVAAWFKADSLHLGRIVTRTNSGGGVRYSYYTGSGGGVSVDLGTTTGNYYYGTGGSAYAAGTWYHTVFTYDSGEGKARIYLDGVLKNEVDASGTLLTTDQPLYFGSHLGTSEFFNGVLDDIRLYSRALSPAEVQKLYKSAPGPIGYWKLDEGSTNTCPGGTNDACDSSTNGYDASWQGNARSTQGRFGSGVTFDGTGDYIQAPDINF